MKFKAFFHQISTFKFVYFTAIVLGFLSWRSGAQDLLSVPDPAAATPVSAGGDSYNPTISADGRYVVFTSSANNLARRSDGTPYNSSPLLNQNVFVRDRLLGTTALVSADSTDSKAGDDSGIPAGISTNGQYILFETASRLIPARNSTNRLNTSEVYLRDIVNKTTTLVSVRTNSVFNFSSRESVMTPDARYVAFDSADANFVPGDTNKVSDVFVRDLVSGTVQMASVGFTNQILSYGPEITPDGKFVAFVSTLVSANPTQDVYVCDLAASNTFCVSTNSHSYISGLPTCYGQKISDDGKYVAYQANANFGGTAVFIFRHNIQTGADDLVTSNAVQSTPSMAFDMTPDGRFIAFLGKTNSSTGVFLWDGQTGNSTFVSSDTNGLAPASMTCEAPRVDVTGRYVSFFGIANGLVTNATGNFVQHIYRRDLQAGITELVDVGMDGNATNRNLNTDFSMSSDGRLFAFDSSDADLVPQDGNSASDVFVRDLNAATTELVSATDPFLMTQTSGRFDRRSNARVSADGHLAVFIARGERLVAGQTNRFRQVFARDLLNQTNSVVSVDTNGLDNADGPASDCAISADGRYVTFTSVADNLVTNDSNGVSDVFLRDLQTGTTTLVSKNAILPISGNGASSSPSISWDGRYVTFLSQADSIAKNNGPFAGPGKTNLFQYDLTYHTNSILTTNSVGPTAVSPDGRYVAFTTSLTSGSSLSLYVWDSQTKQRVYTNNISVNPASLITISTNGQWVAYISTGPIQLSLVDRLTRSNSVVSSGQFGPRPNPHFSGDARYLVYSTPAINSPLDANFSRDVYVFDILTRTNILVSRSYLTGNAPIGNSDSPDISADGRYISYESDAADIVPQDNNGKVKDIFLYDQLAGSTTLLSASSYQAGTANYVSQSPAFTANGQSVAFQSWASDIATNDFNQGSELFLFKILSAADATNPPPVLTGQILFNPGSGSGSSQTAPQLTWQAVPGTGYQVQYKTNLTDDTWLPVNGSVVIQNGVGYLKDAAPDPDHRFYRIVAF